jgi:hypothetical protein
MTAWGWKPPFIIPAQAISGIRFLAHCVVGAKNGAKPSKRAGGSWQELVGVVVSMHEVELPQRVRPSRDKGAPFASWRKKQSQRPCCGRAGQMGRQISRVRDPEV